MAWKPQRFALLLLDAVLFAVAWLLAYTFRFFEAGIPDSIGHTGDNYWLQMKLLWFWVVATHVGFYWVFSLYRGMLRYASTTEMRALLLANGAQLLLWCLINLFLETRERFLDLPVRYDAAGDPMQVIRIPYGILVFYTMLATLATGGVRFSRRMLLESSGRGAAQEAPRTLIVGAGDVAESALRNLMRMGPVDMHPVCAVATTANRVGLHLHGVPVVGTIDKIPDVIKDQSIQKVLIALDDPSPEALRRVVSACESAEVTFRIVPTMSDIAEGRVEVSQTREVQLEDLLGREPVRLELPEDRNYLEGETVLITGAGGSIGAELTRQAAASRAARLLLLGKGENSIFDIANEIARRFPGVETVPIIADIRDAGRIEKVFAEHRPTIVFHAAAHKHVPLMERAPDEAVKNNIVGTWNVMTAAEKHAAKRFVLISSDKAVSPSSVMGATKRFAELLLMALAPQSQCCFQAVRFGNVLGSRGSVIPLFKEQIRHGGPVTVTHPDVMRYFMTIPEAVSLVLQAGSRAENGALYVLDMGEPVKIADLARNLIVLSGFRPGIDIKVEYVGLRPGEKLTEELLTEEEEAERTDIDKVMLARSRARLTLDDLEPVVTRLRALAEEGSGPALLSVLGEALTDYHPPHTEIEPEAVIPEEHEPALSESSDEEIGEDIASLLESPEPPSPEPPSPEPPAAITIEDKPFQPEVQEEQGQSKPADESDLEQPRQLDIELAEPPQEVDEEERRLEELDAFEHPAEEPQPGPAIPPTEGEKVVPDIELAEPPEPVEEEQERDEELDRVFRGQDPGTGEKHWTPEPPGDDSDPEKEASSAPQTGEEEALELFQYQESEELMSAPEKAGKPQSVCLLLRTAKGTDKQTLELLVKQIQEHVLAEGDELVVAASAELIDGLPANTVETGGRPEGAVTQEVVEKLPETDILITLTSDVLPTAETVSAFRQALSAGEAVLAYSDYTEDRDGETSEVKLHDHEGCPHERFEFGPVIGYSLKQVRQLGGFRKDLNFAWEYDMHLKLMEKTEFTHIRQSTYTRFIPVTTDSKGKKVFSPGMGPLGGFSYVFYPEDVEKEVTSVFEEALKRRGCWIDHPFKTVDYSKSNHEVLATVVVPILNRKRFIGNAIQKVLDGTFSDFEMVIVDNGSTDGTIEEVQKYAQKDSRIRLIHGKGSSIASAINEGIRAARGKYICQLDSDDEYAPDTLEMMTAHFENNPQCGLAISYYRLMDEDGKIIEDIDPITHGGYSRNQILRRDGAGALRVFPKVVLEEFGLYDEEHYGNFGEDYDMVVKTGEWYSVDRVHKVLYHYRRHEDNTDVTRDPEMKYKNKNRARQEALKRRRKINEQLGKV